MKKTRIAIGVVVALGVIWTGGAWLTGKKLEANRDQMVQNANRWLNDKLPQGHLTLSYQDYQRGLFSSKVRLVLQSTSQTTDDAFLKPGQSIVFAETIDHGPFPLAQLGKGNLLPAMASVHSELQNTDPLKKLFKLTKDKPFISADTRVGYGGATDSDIHLLPIDYQNAQSGERVGFNGSDLSIAGDAEGNKVSYDGTIDSLAITAKNEMDMPVLFTLNGFSIKGDTHLGSADVRVGEQSVDLKKLTASVDGKEAFNAEGLKLSSSFTSDDKNIGGQFDYSMDALKLQGQDFGSAKLTLKLAQLDAAAMKTFSDNYRNEMQPLVDQQNVDPLVMQEKSREILAKNLPLLLKGNPIITIAPLSWKNAKGESTFNLSAYLKDPAAVQGGSDGNVNQIASNVVKSLDAKLVIPMAMATETMTRVGMAEGYSQDQAEKLADQQVKGFAAMGQMFRLTTQQDNNVQASLQFADGQVTMNGEKMPLDQFISRYMLGGAAPQEMPQ